MVYNEQGQKLKAFKLFNECSKSETISHKKKIQLNEILTKFDVPFLS